MSLTSVRVAPLTMGVEEEFFVVDAATGALVPRGRDTVTAASDELGHSVTSELNRSQVEVKSAVCATLDALGSDLGRLRRRLAAACAPLGLAPLTAEATHVGIDDAVARIEVMNRSRAWLPAILALSANSPYWQGDDSGYAGYRTEVWQRFGMRGEATHTVRTAMSSSGGGCEETAAFSIFWARSSAGLVACSAAKDRACRAWPPPGWLVPRLSPGRRGGRRARSLPTARVNAPRILQVPTVTPK